jgi:hypothetical protein
MWRPPKRREVPIAVLSGEGEGRCASVTKSGLERLTVLWLDATDPRPIYRYFLRVRKDTNRRNPDRLFLDYAHYWIQSVCLGVVGKDRRAPPLPSISPMRLSGAFLKSAPGARVLSMTSTRHREFLEQRVARLCNATVIFVAAACVRMRSLGQLSEGGSDV